MRHSYKEMTSQVLRLGQILEKMDDFGLDHADISRPSSVNLFQELFESCCEIGTTPIEIQRACDYYVNRATYVGKSKVNCLKGKESVPVTVLAVHSSLP